MNSRRVAIVLAAGEGKRMKSDLAKTLHPIAGRPIIEHVLENLRELGLEKVVVVIGHQGKALEAHLQGKFTNLDIDIRWQHELKGTGYAVQMAEPALEGFSGSVLVVAGDVPFVSSGTLSELFETHEKNDSSATCLSAEFPDPAGYGRVVRQGDSDRLAEIVEDRDASDEILAIKEINSGIFVFDAESLFSALTQVTDDNTQGEYYLTDVISILGRMGQNCLVSRAENPDEVRGINTFEQLAELEKLFRPSAS